MTQYVELEALLDAMLVETRMLNEYMAKMTANMKEQDDWARDFAERMNSQKHTAEKRGYSTPTDERLYT